MQCGYADDMPMWSRSMPCAAVYAKPSALDIVGAMSERIPPVGVYPLSPFRTGVGLYKDSPHS